MNEIGTDTYGVLTEPDTLTIRRRLPGPIERVWQYLVDGDLRRQWLASGRMEMAAGSAFEFVWRNDELNDPPGRRPEGFDAEYRMKSRITECEPPHRLTFTWENGGEVTFELEPEGEAVLFTITHRRLADRKERLQTSAGWHAHLDVLEARMNGKTPPQFWDTWVRLEKEYERWLPR